MSDGRFTVLPDVRLSAVRGIVSTRMDEVALALASGGFEDFFTPTMRGALLDGFEQVGAHEGTVWLIDASERFLIPRFNNGPNAATFVGRFRQSLQSGMIGMVVATQQPICENRAHLNAVHDPRLDQELGLVTSAMIAVPFYFASQLRGVISAVQLQRAKGDEPELPGFSPRHLSQLQLTADVLERLIEHELLTLSLGLGAALC
jgi:hypothetical protein